MLADIFGIDTPLVVLIALIVLFGGSQLPKIARSIGSAGREFRKAQKEADEEAAQEEAAKTAAQAAKTPAPQPLPATSQVDDKITLSRADLEALVDQRLGKAKAQSPVETQIQPGVPADPSAN